MLRAEIVSKGEERYRSPTSCCSPRCDASSDGCSPNPGDTLLASLCACLGHYVGDYLHQEKIPFTKYTVAAQCELTEDRSRLGDIHVTIEVTDAEWDEAARCAMLKHTTKCFIHNTLKANSLILMTVKPS